MNTHLISFEKNRKRYVALILIVVIFLISILCFVGYFISKDNFKVVEINEVYAAEDAANHDAFTDTVYFLTAFASDNKNNEWWLLGDKYGEFHAVKLNAKERASLEEIYNYSISTDESLPIPESVNLIGRTKLMNEQLMEFAHTGVLEYFEEDISFEDFASYTRGIYLDVGNQSSANSYIILGSIFLLLSLVVLYLYLASCRKAKKSLFALQESGANIDIIELLKEELSQEDTVMFGKQLYLTKNHVIYADGSVSAVNYESIDNIYLFTYRLNFIPFYYLNVISNDTIFRFSMGFGEKAKSQIESCILAINAKQAEKKMSKNDQNDPQENNNSLSSDSF